MVRIWLNHWFSTAYSIIQLLRKDEPEFYLIGSNARKQAVYQTVCDEWYQEPVLEENAYVEYCLQFCQEHHVDVFLPRRGMQGISRNKAKFADIGVRVMADDYEKIEVLNRKTSAYETFRQLNIGNVPDYACVTNVQEFRKACQRLSGQYGQVCFKFVRDEGGQSFRLIDNQKRGYHALFYPQSTVRMTQEAAEAALSERESFPPLMVMPYLPGEEVSVDCLRTAQGIIMLPRMKDASRVERLHFDPEILQMCQAFFERFGLEQPCNIQFKYREGTPYFLEVNTRMSGGVQMACLAAGVNIPNIAVNQLIGVEKPWTLQQKDCFVSHAEIPVLLSAESDH